MAIDRTVEQTLEQTLRGFVESEGGPLQVDAQKWLAKKMVTRADLEGLKILPKEEQPVQAQVAVPAEAPAQAAFETVVQTVAQTTTVAEPDSNEIAVRQKIQALADIIADVRTSAEDRANARQAQLEIVKKYQAEKAATSPTTVQPNPVTMSAASSLAAKANPSVIDATQQNNANQTSKIRGPGQ